MIKKPQIILFSVLILFFFLSAPIAILYSQGYRFDFKTRRIIQTGGLFLKISPSTTEIYLDKKLFKKTNFLLDSVLIQDLLPQKYFIEVKKEGYFSWEKNLVIEKKQVTEAKNITLIPENPEFKVLLKNIKEAWLTPDQKKAVLKEEAEEGWSLKLFDLEKEIKSHLIKEKEVSRFESELLSLTFSNDSKKVLLKLGLKEQIKHYVIDINNPVIALISLDFLPLSAEKVSFNPQNSTELFFLQESRLFKADLIARQTTPSLLDKILIYKTSSNELYYLDESGHFFTDDFSFNRATRLSSSPFVLKGEVEHELEIIGGSIFFREADETYFFNRVLKTFNKWDGKDDFLKLSPDSKKIVQTDKHEVWLYFLEDINDQPLKKAGTFVFLTRVAEEISQIYWINSNYLLFNSGGEIKIAEIDDRDKINIYSLSEFKDLKLFWNLADKKIYILSDGNFYQSSPVLK